MWLTSRTTATQKLAATKFCKQAVPLGAVFWVAVLFLLGSLRPSFAADTYVRAMIDQAGKLRITTKDRREILPKKDVGQVGFDKPTVSPGGHFVGWVALFPNCCTSYPIPLQLVVLSQGRERKFTGNGLPIWLWSFQAGGENVAFKQETVHGGFGIHYEVRNITTGSLVAEYEPPYDRNNQVLYDPKEPAWVAEFLNGIMKKN